MRRSTAARSLPPGYRIADDTGAPFLEVVEALRRHRMDEEAATAELSDIRAKAHPEATTR